MVDQFGRTIDYMRLSITDRCNLRCRYCMPDGVVPVDHTDVLTYEELLQVAAAGVDLGITKFKVTGGEPLARLGCVDFLARLKALPGVEQVTLTTNGVLLAPLVPRLAELGIDGVNVSLDAPDRETFAAVTGFDVLPKVLESLDALLAAGIKTKLNCVLLPGCEERLIPLARFVLRGLDVRFIEVMPIGAGAAEGGPSRDAALEILRREWPDLHEVNEHRGNGPAHYYASAALAGRIGMIDAVSHKFCAGCNRVRLTSTGLLKPCLCYGEGADLRAVLRGLPGALQKQPNALYERPDALQEQPNASRERPGVLTETLRAAIYAKPQAHCFDSAQHITEQKSMSQIGG